MRFFALAMLAVLAVTRAASAAPMLPQVDKTGTIRCGYIEYVPALSKNLETGQFEGFDYDMVQAIASRLGLKVEYTAPTGWGNVAADLRAGKYDMLCSGFWVHANMGKYVLFSRPFFYQPVFVVGRKDDTRLGDASAASLNTPDLSMVGLEGDNPIEIAHTDFPQAKVIELPGMTDFSQVLVNVADKKADFTIVDAVTFGNYDEHNPGRLTIVNPEKPLRTYPVAYAFGSEDSQFRDAVNYAIEELILDGTVDRIFDRYDRLPYSYYRAVVPYRDTYSPGKK